MEFNPKYNIKAVKGFALANFKDSLGTNIHLKNLHVFFMGKPLKDKDKLVHLNCGKSALVVKHQSH